jgi:signal transduction histidine kinase
MEPDASRPLDPAELVPLVESLNAALESLREITVGVFPAQLARSGLEAALGSLLARPGSTGRLVVRESAVGQRFEPQVEAAAYFCVSEASRDLGEPVVVVVSAPDDRLEILVEGGDRGGVPLGHMQDRVEAAGGQLSLTAQDGQIALDVRLPARSPGPVSAVPAQALP